MYSKVNRFFLLGVHNMQQASRKAEPGDYKHPVNDMLNGPHRTPVHDFLSVA